MREVHVELRGIKRDWFQPHQGPLRYNATGRRNRITSAPVDARLRQLTAFQLR